SLLLSYSCFFFHDTPTTAIYTLSLHDALPISLGHSLQVRGKNREQKKRQRQSGGECQHPEQRPHASGLNRRRQQGFVLVDLYTRSEEHTSELQSRGHLVCRLLLEKKKEPTSAS